jgi:hypothetical protein
MNQVGAWRAMPLHFPLYSLLQNKCVPAFSRNLLRAPYSILGTHFLLFPL